jgi:hypothetical protein
MEFLVYKKFYKQERVTALTQLLSEHGIDFEIAEDRESLDSLYGDKHFNRQIFIKLKRDDFAKADSLLLQESEKQLENVGKDHYLYDFTDEELFDILCKPDEWNALDYQLSKKILKERGREINADTIALLKKQRVNELAKPEEGQKNWIYAGYVFALLGGLLGIFIGWHLSTFKKTLPDGQRVFAYKKEDRSHGTIILILGIIMLGVSLAIRMATTEY